MNHEAFKLVITNPCTKNWDAMLQTNDGRHCNSCKKDVIDFSRMNDEEVKKYFIRNKDTPTCGRFYLNQLDRIKIHLPENILKSDIDHWKKYIIILMICFGVNLFSMEVVLGQTLDSFPAKDSIKTTDTLKVSDSTKIVDTTMNIDTLNTDTTNYRVGNAFVTVKDSYYIPQDSVFTITIGDIIMGVIGSYPYVEPSIDSEKILSRIEERYTAKKLPVEKKPFQKQEPFLLREFIIPDKIKIRKRK